MNEILRQGLAAFSLPQDAVPALEKYGSLLLAKNQEMNLTAITEPEQVARLHVLDCAALLNCADFLSQCVDNLQKNFPFFRYIYLLH